MVERSWSDPATWAQDASGWRAGDRFVVASTDFDPHQAEERTIRGVSGETVTLDRPLEHSHRGSVQTIAWRTVDERAEVALLSRNVVVSGEEATSAGGFRGQIMVMDGGHARIEGAELTRMGQKNALRRYPLHFHMLGEGRASSYLRKTSIHETYNRCLTVHGTDRLRISGNVCHDHLGHGYFFEDGAETDNSVTGNLGLTTRRPAEGERLLPSDGSPATFWITNSDNVVRNNVARSEGKGFRPTPSTRPASRPTRTSGRAAPRWASSPATPPTPRTATGSTLTAAPGPTGPRRPPSTSRARSPRTAARR